MNKGLLSNHSALINKHVIENTLQSKWPSTTTFTFEPACQYFMAVSDDRHHHWGLSFCFRVTMETHNFVIPGNASKKGDICRTDLQAAVDIVPASASSVPCVAAKCKSRSPSQPVHSSSASHEICSILWSQMFIVTFTRACHMLLS